MKTKKRWLALGGALIVLCAAMQFGGFSRTAASVVTASAPVSAEDRQPDKLNLRAPELVGAQWLNTAPLRLAERRGKVTIVEFWTFACGNCRANLPAYARWQQRFANRDVAVIGVHTPETATEANPANVRRRVKELGITYPVLLDEGHKNWNAWEQEYWPTVYLVDKQGTIRYRWAGELEYRSAGGEEKLAKLVEQLLAE